MSRSGIWCHFPPWVSILLMSSLLTLPLFSLIFFSCAACWLNFALCGYMQLVAWQSSYYQVRQMRGFQTLLKDCNCSVLFSYNVFFFLQNNAWRNTVMPLKDNWQTGQCVSRGVCVLDPSLGVTKRIVWTYDSMSWRHLCLEVHVRALSSYCSISRVALKEMWNWAEGQ